MLRNAKLIGIDYYLPSNILSNNDLEARFPEWNVEKIVSKIGINQRYIADEQETSLDMGIKASVSLLNKTNFNKADIDAILFCTASPDYLIPPNACLLQSALGLPTASLAIDYNLGCSGYVYGLSLAYGLIISCQAKNVLLVTAETYSKFISPNDKGNLSLFGDAATASIISHAETEDIKKFIWYSNGELAMKLIAPRSGFAKNKNIALSDNSYSDYLYMDGPAIFQFTLDVVPNMINECLRKNLFSKNEIDYYVLHQANSFMLKNLAKKADLESEKVIIDGYDVGNTVCNSIPLALARKIEDGTIKKGSRVMLVGFGVGLSASATIIVI